jgi:hypothetical protein
MINDKYTNVLFHVRKAKACPHLELHNFTVWVSYDPYKQLLDPALKKLATDKHSSLFRRSIIDKEDKRFKNLPPGLLVLQHNQVSLKIKHFSSLLMLLAKLCIQILSL